MIVFSLTLSQTLGLPQIMNTLSLWPYLIGKDLTPFVGLSVALNAIPCAVGLLCMICCPESARYLYFIKGDEDGAINGNRFLEYLSFQRFGNYVEMMMISNQRYLSLNKKTIRTQKRFSPSYHLMFEVIHCRYFSHSSFVVRFGCIVCSTRWATVFRNQRGQYAHCSLTIFIC